MPRTLNNQAPMKPPMMPVKTAPIHPPGSAPGTTMSAAQPTRPATMRVNSRPMVNPMAMTEPAPSTITSRINKIRHPMAEQTHVARLMLRQAPTCGHARRRVPHAGAAAIARVDDHVAAHIDLAANVEEQRDSIHPLRLTPIPKQVDGQTPVRLEQVAHAPQEGLAEDTPRHARSSEQIDGDIVETLGARLDVLEGVAHDDVEPAGGQPARVARDGQNGGVVVNPDHRQFTPAGSQQAG